MFQELLIPFATFTIGVFVGGMSGWFGHKHVSKKEIENWERAMITVVVSFAWVISVILDVALQTYETPVALHGVMGMVVGYFFEGNIFNRGTK
jgi:ABC-type microcin C transport system permease subunit YejE